MRKCETCGGSHYEGLGRLCKTCQRPKCPFCNDRMEANEYHAYDGSFWFWQCGCDNETMAEIIKASA